MFLNILCKKYDIIQDVKKKKIKKAEYQELIFKELEENYLSFVNTIKTANTKYGHYMDKE